VKTNLEIFDETISASIEKYLYYPDLNREFQIVFVIKPNYHIKNAYVINTNEDSEAKYLRSIIKKIASSEKLRFSFADDETKISADSVLNLFILNPVIMQTNYNGFGKNRFLGDKTIKRNIKINISISIRTTYNNLKVSDVIEGNYNDEVNLDYYDNIESSQYEFTQATPPEAGEFESLIFPAVLVLASAGATLLFFVIRSK